jgi:hypothetical protein
MRSRRRRPNEAHTPKTAAMGFARRKVAGTFLLPNLLPIHANNEAKIG